MPEPQNPSTVFVRTGREEFAQEALERFGARLIGLARGRLDRRTRAKVDPEDVVQSALRSFFARDADGQFRIESWDDLWRILVVITVRKCHRKVWALRRARRDVRRELVAAAESEPADVVAEVAGREPSPDEVAIFLETLERLLASADEREREILILRLEGYTPPEIAERVGGISERKVFRVLAQARTWLTKELG